MEKSIFSILVANHYGVLTKVAGVFGRRSCNIQSLTVCATKDPMFSRITVVAEDSEETIRQVYNQTSKLEDVREITLLPAGGYYERTLALLRLRPEAKLPTDLPEVLRTIECTCNGVTVLEVVGSTETVDTLINRLGDDVIDLSLSGATALPT